MVFAKVLTARRSRRRILFRMTVAFSTKFRIKRHPIFVSTYRRNDYLKPYRYKRYFSFEHRPFEVFLPSPEKLIGGKKRVFVNVSRKVRFCQPASLSFLRETPAVLLWQRTQRVQSTNRLVPGDYWHRCITSFCVVYESYRKIMEDQVSVRILFPISPTLWFEGFSHKSASSWSCPDSCDRYLCMF